jgi:hypothetical protein
VTSTTTERAMTAMANHLIDHVGQRFHRLVVIGRAENDHYGSNWICRCDCGNQRKVRGANLRQGAVRSCGCTVREASSKRVRKHGLSNTSEWRIWAGMRRRCRDERLPQYPLYGGRGIKVCERWGSFDNFYEDMGPRPSTGHSLDRIDNDGDYEPSNCKWATQLEQQNNKSTSHNIEWRGRTQTLTEWCRELGIIENTLRARIRKGWSIDDAFLRPAISRAAPRTHPKYNPARAKRFREVSARGS